MTFSTVGSGDHLCSFPTPEGPVVVLYNCFLDPGYTIGIVPDKPGRARSGGSEERCFVG